MVGTKLMLQLLSFHKPSVAVATLPRFKEVLSSMESRVPASLSLLWVMSQAAVKDTSIGIQGKPHPYNCCYTLSLVGISFNAIAGDWET